MAPRDAVYAERRTPLPGELMEERQPLDRTRIEEAFRFMGQYLLDRKAFGEIATYKGSAILFQFDWRKTSVDVDAWLISAGNHTLVMDAVHEAARRLDLPRSWLNESVAMYARRGEEDNDRVFVGLYPSAERFGLRVTAAKPSYVLAMKLKALERTTADDRDYEDAVQLALACDVRTVEQLRALVRSFFSDEELPQRVELRLPEVAKTVAARRGESR